MKLLAILFTLTLVSCGSSSSNAPDPSIQGATSDESKELAKDLQASLWCVENITLYLEGDDEPHRYIFEFYKDFTFDVAVISKETGKIAETTNGKYAVSDNLFVVEIDGETDKGNYETFYTDGDLGRIDIDFQEEGRFELFSCSK